MSSWSDEPRLASAIVTRLAVLALVVVLMDGPGRPDVDAPVVISQRLLEALRREAVPELAAALGSDAPSVVELRLCDAAEMRAVLAREAAAREHLARPAGLADLAGIASPQFAEWILGKYVLGEDLVLVQPSAFALTAELLDEPGFVTRGLLGAVLAHELVHAADDARHDLSAVTRSLAQAEQLTTLAAAVEGHAQQVARDVSQRLGWSKGFLAFTRAVIGDVDPVSDDLAALPWMQLERVLNADLRAAYGKGEDFVRGLRALGGDAALDAAIRYPSRDLAVLDHPAWLLDPSSRPTARYDLDHLLGAMRAEFPTPPWTIGFSAASSSSHDAVLFELPAPRRATLLDSLLDSRMLSGTRDLGGVFDAQALVLTEMLDESSAAAWVAAAAEIARREQDAGAGGVFSIESSSQEHLALDGLPGLLVTQRLRVGRGEDAPTQRLCEYIAHHGPLVVRIVAAGPDASRQTVLRLAAFLLEGLEDADAVTSLQDADR